MLAAIDLRTLTAWCSHRAMRWLALRADADGAALLLEPLIATRPWQRMHLLAGDEGFLLQDEAGQALATASDLPALLDALDGGVADTAAVVMPPALALTPREAMFA